jgi:hypothetical protein
MLCADGMHAFAFGGFAAGSKWRLYSTTLLYDFNLILHFYTATSEVLAAGSQWRLASFRTAQPAPSPTPAHLEARSSHAHSEAQPWQARGLARRQQAP